MAAIKPSPGEVVETSTQTRIRKDVSQDDEKVRLPIWDYVETVQLADWSNGEYEFTIYRGKKSEKADEKTWIGKFREKITPEVIQSRWGGGEYNVWLKCPPGFQLRYNVDLKIEGMPKTNGNGSYSSTPAAGDPLSQLVALFRDEMRTLREELNRSRGSDLQIEAIKQALTLNGQVFSSGAQSLQTTLASVGGGGTPPARDPLIERLLTVAIERLVSAPQPATNSVKDTIEMIGTLKNAGLFGAPGEGKTTMALELVRQLPTVANSLVHGLQAWQGAEEARARSIAMTRGAGAPQPPIPVQPIPQPMPAQPAPAAAEPSAASGQTQVPMQEIPGVKVQPMPVETLEQMICAIVADENLTVEQAANEACALIERSAPGQTDLMVKQGEEWIFNLFQIRPVLQQVAQHPRLRDFVKKFVEVVKAAPVVQSPNPAAPVA